MLALLSRVVREFLSAGGLCLSDEGFIEWTHTQRTPCSLLWSMPMHVVACPKGLVAQLSLRRCSRQCVSFLASSEPESKVLVLGFLLGWNWQIHLPKSKICDFEKRWCWDSFPMEAVHCPNKDFGRPSSLHDDVSRALHFN